MRHHLGKALHALVFVVFAMTAGCDAGGGTETALPPGEPTNAPPGNLVLYASLFDADRVVGYRLGTDGLMPREPFTSIDFQEPRSIVLNGNVLYVLLEDRIVALTVAADGSLPRFLTSQTAPVLEADGADLLVNDGTIYAAFQGIDSVYAYALQSGQLTPDPLSISGLSDAIYRSLAIGDGFLYAGSLGSAQIDTYVIQSDGSLPDNPEPRDPETEIFRPEDMIVRDGILYSIAQAEERIEAFHIQSNGLLPEEFDTRTATSERYVRILLDGDRMYASGIAVGRVEMFLLATDGDLIQAGPAAVTASDAASYPVGLVLNAGILYVAQAGLGRVDAYVLGADGAPPAFPSSSTDEIENSFPSELALGSFPP